ncbi:b8ba3338-b268-4887-bf40-7e4ea470975d [Thermothielavioides terrestris]|uniref:B8ba3338-b268-4887-bf40-7e4ea470975d n=1 Tax=Thermothielavioides terrestris TaxID=2587410 RepID=A0A3S4AUB9_9PEZI|nr:b8ba3338-b268-4887-bf40-7e4ea470975d [Thermothielavioides terrestris]
MPASSDIPLDWEGHRRKIEDLYWNQAKELPEVMQIMKDVYGFVATKKMYKKHLKAWGLEKNLKTAESIAMLKIAERRRAANKDTRFTCRGRPVEPGKLRRFAKRHNLVVDGAANALSDQKVSTPPSITYTTPEPDPSNNSLPPAPLPYPESDTSEADQVEPEDPAGSSAFDNGKAPNMNSAHAIAAALPDASNSALEHTPLHDAVVANRVDLVKDLLERGANPNCAARGGMSPLHYAAYQRNVELVALLLKFGANLDAMTDKKRSILFFAVRGRGHESNDDMLAYASQNSVGNSSHTDEATIRVLRALFDSPSGWIRLRRCLDKADKDGVTPLMVAAEQGFEDTVRLLLRRGAQPDVKNHAGHTALKYAASSNHRMLVRLLLEADPGILDRDLSHLLKLASRNFTARAATDHVHEKDGQDAWCDDYHKFTSRLIAEEMVQLCRERGLLDGLLTLAAQRRKANVLELLLGAMTKLGIGRPGARLLSGC